MKTNTDPSFVGIDDLKATHSSQIAEFESWADAAEWERFHHSHYDWWVFPVNRRSSYGLKWTVYEGEIYELKKDNIFLERYVRGVQLVSASWGWDVVNATYLDKPHPGQTWHNWPVRLYKAAQSVKLFGYADLFDSLRSYALDLMEQGEPMTYGTRDLSWLFTSGIDPLSSGHR